MSRTKKAAVLARQKRKRENELKNAKDASSVHPDVNTISPFQKKKVSLLVSLEPSSLVDTRQALETSMHSLLLKYSDGLGGVLLAFDNLEFDREHRYGQILNEMPHIHYRVTCDVVVFFPALKTTLVGVVNDVFPSHVGLLVHKLFNASVSAEALRLAGYTFDKEENQWKQSNSGSCAVGKGDQMSFCVDKLHECNGLISLEGSKPSLISII